MYPTSRYWIGKQESYPTVLLGYGAMEEDHMTRGVELLARAWFPQPNASME
ncbi:hypothetical protein [Paenibacillus sp. J2TS4]|uniref:hypothetical protein n=1 Tax=Paenibacillus sp. J2TS4 TaxID=2807194 RepID=UPI001B02A550|nr:hypothetical protein [Paenibacillus sp. J2TS4]GIP34153.1 hypothetical protein J2TS4_33630 [Paenibacillus sp. J2TS4]